MRTLSFASKVSANIVAFPVTAQSRDRLRARIQGTTSASAVPVVEDGGWYHEAALAEEMASSRAGRSEH